MIVFTMMKERKYFLANNHTLSGLFNYPPGAVYRYDLDRGWWMGRFRAVPHFTIRTAIYYNVSRPYPAITHMKLIDAKEANDIVRAWWREREPLSKQQIATLDCLIGDYMTFDWMLVGDDQL